MAGFSYQDNITAVVNALRDHNTTTASPDLSDGVSSRIKDVHSNHPRVFGIRYDLLPAIFVWTEGANEDYASLGNTGVTGNRKQKDVRYNVLGIYRKEGGVTPHADALEEMYRLAGNIESVFEQEYDLSGTALWCNPASTEFLEPGLLGGVWAKGVLIHLEARYHYR